MKILYRARTDTYRFYREGINPSHWLYGAVEMEKEGNEVVCRDNNFMLEILVNVYYSTHKEGLIFAKTR